MTVEQFDNGYWYALEIKSFADDIGIPAASKLRKDELEELIKYFLRTGRIRKPTRKTLKRSGVTDVERGLSLKLPVANYTNDRKTKDFIVREALKIAPKLKRKSGARYRLNRWREQQIDRGIKITYGDVVREYVRLNQMKGSFPQVQIPSGRYINFLSDFLAGEKNPTRAGALKAWKQLKKAEIPKHYREWKKKYGKPSA